MRLIVWNSRGSKWDTMWNFFVEPELNPQTEDVMGLLVESGWAPWILPGNPVAVDNIYSIDEFGNRYDEHAALSSFCCEGIQEVRTRKMYWVPWVLTLADVEAGTKSNSRCSMGALVMPYSFQAGKLKRFVDKNFRRPVVSIPMLAQGKKDVEVTVLLVHLVSSQNARVELNRLLRDVRRQIPENTLAIVAGDFNIDLFQGIPALPRNWQILHPVPIVATHQGGSSLDWALIYNPNRIHLTTTATVVMQYQTGVNTSDHSVIRYTIN